LFGEWWSVNGLYAVTKKVYNPDEELYKSFVEYKRVSNMSEDDLDYYLYEDDSYMEYLKNESEIFTEEYPDLVYGPLMKRHLLVRKRKNYFLPKIMHVGTDEQVNEAIKFWKEFK